MAYRDSGDVTIGHMEYIDGVSVTYRPVEGEV